MGLGYAPVLTVMHTIITQYEDRVSFETAKALAENGFDEKVDFFYSGLSHFLVKSVRFVDWNNSNECDTIYYSAPSLGSALDWLFDNLYLHVEIRYSQSDDSYKYRIVDIDTKDPINNYESNEIYSSRWSCMDAAIQKGLSLYGLSAFGVTLFNKKADKNSEVTTPTIFLPDRTTVTVTSSEDESPIQMQRKKVEIIT